MSFNGLCEALNLQNVWSGTGWSSIHQTIKQSTNNGRKRWFRSRYERSSCFFSFLSFYQGKKNLDTAGLTPVKKNLLRFIVWLNRCERIPTDSFTIWEPHSPYIDEFCAILKRRSTYIKALTLWKVGLGCLLRIKCMPIYLGLFCLPDRIFFTILKL